MWSTCIFTHIERLPKKVLYDKSGKYWGSDYRKNSNPSHFPSWSVGEKVIIPKLCFVKICRSVCLPVIMGKNNNHCGMYLYSSEVVIHVNSIATVGVQHTLIVEGTSYLWDDQEERGVYEMSQDTIMRNFVSVLIFRSSIVSTL